MSRYPILEWPEELFRYTDWHSRTPEDLIERAESAGLLEAGDTYRIGWVDRDDLTGEVTYTWAAPPCEDEQVTP